MRRLIAVVIALGAALAIPACGETAGDRDRPVSLPADRLALPEYDIDRYRALLGTLRGRPLVVNFWGSWCPPCEDEAPILAEVSREYEGRVQFLGVDIVDARTPAREFIERYDWPYPSIFDPRDSIRSGLGYIGQPITIVYDAEGELSWDHVGTISAEQLREQIEAVL